MMDELHLSLGEKTFSVTERKARCSKPPEARSSNWPGADWAAFEAPKININQTNSSQWSTWYFSHFVQQAGNQVALIAMPQRDYLEESTNVAIRAGSLGKFQS